MRWKTTIADKLRADVGGATRFDPEAMATMVVATYSGAMAKACQSVAPLVSCAKQLTSIIQNQTSPLNLESGYQAPDKQKSIG